MFAWRPTITWKIMFALVLAAFFLGSGWTYRQFYEVPVKILHAQNQPGLEWRSAVPTLRAAGWVNGPPPPRDQLEGNVVLVDVWAAWCDPCLRSAPGLVKLHAKYSDRVVFVGLTAATQRAAENYAERFKARWPIGYGITGEVTEAFQGIGPVVVIIGRDGRVFWSDGYSRLNHRAERLWERVEQELALALAEDN